LREEDENLRVMEVTVNKFYKTTATSPHPDPLASAPTPSLDFTSDYFVGKRPEAWSIANKSVAFILFSFNFP
jgi:hypothetical protein